MSQDGGLTGYGHVCQPEALIVPEVTSIVRRPLTGRRRGLR